MVHLPPGPTERRQKPPPLSPHPLDSNHTLHCNCNCNAGRRRLFDLSGRTCAACVSCNVIFLSPSSCITASIRNRTAEYTHPLTSGLTSPRRRLEFSVACFYFVQFEKKTAPGRQAERHTIVYSTCACGIADRTRGPRSLNDAIVPRFLCSFRATTSAASLSARGQQRQERRSRIESSKPLDSLHPLSTRFAHCRRTPEDPNR